jgi:hypothetical protein
MASISTPQHCSAGTVPRRVRKKRGDGEKDKGTVNKVKASQPRRRAGCVLKQRWEPSRGKDVWTLDGSIGRRETRRSEFEAKGRAYEDSCKNINRV